MMKHLTKTSLFVWLNLVILSLLSCSCWHYLAVAVKDPRGLMYDGFNVMNAHLAL